MSVHFFLYTVYIVIMTFNKHVIAVYSDFTCFLHWHYRDFWTLSNISWHLPQMWHHWSTFYPTVSDKRSDFNFDILKYPHLDDNIPNPLYYGRIQDFKLVGAHLKKIAPSGGRREHFWGISCENSRFYAKKSRLQNLPPTPNLQF